MSRLTASQCYWAMEQVRSQILEDRPSATAAASNWQTSTMTANWTRLCLELICRMRSSPHYSAMEMVHFRISKLGPLLVSADFLRSVTLTAMAGLISFRQGLTHRGIPQFRFFSNQPCIPAQAPYLSEQ